LYKRKDITWVRERGRRRAFLGKREKDNIIRGKKKISFYNGRARREAGRGVNAAISSWPGQVSWGRRDWVRRRTK